MADNSADPPPPPYTHTMPAGTLPVVAVGQQENMLPKYKSDTIFRLSVVLIILGFFSCTAEIVDIFGSYGKYSYLVSGIIGGINILFAGLLGVYSSFKQNRCSIIAFVTQTTICLVITVYPIMVGSIELMSRPKGNDTHAVSVGLYTFVVVAVLTSWILMVIAAALACQTVCPSKASRQRHEAYGIQYVVGQEGRIILTQTLQGESYYTPSNVPKAQEASYWMDTPPKYNEVVTETK